MSAKYETVKRYYDMRVWNKQRVKAAVGKGWITDEEYALITGESYK